jgi:hypothetical protein
VEALVLRVRLSGESIYHFHIKTDLDKVFFRKAPLNLELWGPASEALVTRVGEAPY